MTYRDPVFRGATRPPMFLGVPMIPFILITGAAVLIGMLLLFVHALLTVLVIALYLPLFVWMRMKTRQDDQRLHQLMLRLRLRARMSGARRYWGALTFTPLNLKRR
ncbi:MAG TPA: VirB3 family type IV secretion system protein [Asticcacaulis sp.]|nr:VirB3 family type IV secretion system protein [Asticcacaulis sp.]